MATSTYEVRITGDAKSLERTLGKVDRSLTGSAKSWAKFAAKGAAVTALGAAVGKTAASTFEFDKSMRNVNSIAQLNEKQYRRLQQSVLALGGPTAQSPRTLAEGLYDLVSSGFDAQDSLKILEASAKAATAGLTTTEVSTKAVAAVLNAYKLPASHADKVSDALFRTVDRGVVSFEELSSTIGDVLPFASSLGVDLQEVGAATATMTKAGIAAPETMTRIKNVMVAMLKPGEGLKAALKDLGFESGEALVKQKGLQGALEALVGTTDGSKVAVAKLFPEIRAMGGALALTGQNAKGAGEDLRGMRESAGATERALSEQAKSLSYKWEKAKAIFEAFAIKGGLALKQFAEELLAWNFTSPTSSAIAYGIAIAGIGTAAFAAGKAVQAFYLLAARHPFGAAMLGAGLLIGALVGLQDEERKTASAYQRSKRALESLGGTSRRTRELRQKERDVAGEVRAAESRLSRVREQFGPRSQPAIEAEAELIRKRRRHREINDQLAKSERASGAERSAVMAILKDDTRRLAREVSRLVSEKEEERYQLANLVAGYKDGVIPLSKVRDKQRELGETTRELNNRNRKLNELIVESGRKIGPHFSDHLAKAAGKAANLARKGGEVNEFLRAMPKKTRTEIEVDIKVGGVNLGTGGRSAGTGSGWPISEFVNSTIKDRVTDRVQAAADKNPLGVFGAAGFGGLGAGSPPSAVDGFNALASHYGLEVTSAFRPGDDGWHGQNRARDYSNSSGPTPQMFAFATFMAKTFGSRLLELIYTPLGFSIKNGQKVAPFAQDEHYDHVHVALQRGGGLAATVPGTSTGDNHLLSLNGIPVARVESQEGIFVGNRELMAALHAANDAVPRFQSGGEAKPAYAGRYGGEKFQKLVRKLWREAAPLFGKSPKSEAPMPVLAPGLVRKTGHVGEAFEDGSLRIDRGWAKQLLKGHPYARQILLHEWAHLNQAPDVWQVVWAREGGATNFSRWGAQKIWGDVPGVYPKGYRGFAERVLAEKGWPWVKHGQFKGLQKGGAVKGLGHHLQVALRDIWPKAAAYYGRRPSSPMPWTFVAGEKKMDGRAGYVAPWETAPYGKTATLSRAAALGVIGAGEPAGRGTLVHEWAHIFQRGGLKPWESEGGAEAFKTWAGPRIFPGAAMATAFGSRTLAYERHKQRVLREKPDAWVRRGQFRGFQKGGIVGQIGAILMRHGLDKEAAAGIIGNAYGESGWNPAAIEPGTHNGGLWGFTASPVSLQDLKNYATKQGMPWTSVKAQTQFLIHHLGIHDPNYKNRLNSMDSVQETTESFLRDWEKPENESSMGKRIGAAKKALKMLDGDVAAPASKQQKSTLAGLQRRAGRLLRDVRGLEEQYQNHGGTGRGKQMLNRALKFASMAAKQAKAGNRDEAKKLIDKARDALGTSRSAYKKALEQVFTPGLKKGALPPVAASTFDAAQAFSTTNLPGLDVLPKSVRQQLRSPGLTSSGKYSVLENALAAAGETETKADDGGALNAMLGLQEQRRKRLKKRLDNLNRRLSKPGLTQKQRENLVKERNAVLSELGESAAEISSIREQIGGLNEESESAGDQAREALEANTRATEEHTTALQEVAAQLKAQTDFAKAATSSSSATAWKALADIMSGTLGGTAQLAANTAGNGSIGTLNRF